MLKNLAMMVAVLAAASMFGCDDDDGTGDGGVAGSWGDGSGSGGSVSTAQGYATGMAEILCAKAFECCPDGDDFMEDQASCEMFIGLFMGDAMTKAVEAGYTVFDSGQANVCLAETRTFFNDISCEAGFDMNTLPQPPSCEGVLIGQRAEGETCSIPMGDEEDSGRYTSDSHCQLGFVCEGMGDEVCMRPAVQGEACSFDLPCVEGLRCARDESNERTCQAKVVIGGACSGYDDCLDSGECQDEICVAPSGDMCGN